MIDKHTAEAEKQVREEIDNGVQGFWHRVFERAKRLKLEEAMRQRNREFKESLDIAEWAVKGARVKIAEQSEEIKRLKEQPNYLNEMLHMTRAWDAHPAWHDGYPCECATCIDAGNR